MNESLTELGQDSMNHEYLDENDGILRIAAQDENKNNNHGYTHTGVPPPVENTSLYTPTTNTTPCLNLPTLAEEVIRHQSPTPVADVKLTLSTSSEESLLGSEHNFDYSSVLDDQLLVTPSKTVNIALPFEPMQIEGIVEEGQPGREKSNPVEAIGGRTQKPLSPKTAKQLKEKLTSLITQADLLTQRLPLTNLTSGPVVEDSGNSDVSVTGNQLTPGQQKQLESQPSVVLDRKLPDRDLRHRLTRGSGTATRGPEERAGKKYLFLTDRTVSSIEKNMIQLGDKDYMCNLCKWRGSYQRVRVHLKQHYVATTRLVETL